MNDTYISWRTRYEIKVSQITILEEELKDSQDKVSHLRGIIKNMSKTRKVKERKED